MKEKTSRWLSFWHRPWQVALAIFCLDQATKWVISTYWEHNGNPTVIIPNFFDIVHFKNPGGAWGVLGSHTEILTLLTVCFAIVLIWKFKLWHEGSAHRAVSLTCLAGGVWGNLFDRVFRFDADHILGQGEVIDFIFFHVEINGKFWSYPAFNVADIAICLGTISYLWFSWRDDPKRNPKKIKQDHD